MGNKCGKCWSFLREQCHGAMHSPESAQRQRSSSGRRSKASRKGTLEAGSVIAAGGANQPMGPPPPSVNVIEATTTNEGTTSSSQNKTTTVALQHERRGSVSAISEDAESRITGWVSTSGIRLTQAAGGGGAPSANPSMYNCMDEQGQPLVNTSLSGADVNIDGGGSTEALQRRSDDGDGEQRRASVDN